VSRISPEAVVTKQVHGPNHLRKIPETLCVTVSKQS
jgi:hypothetical protein